MNETAIHPEARAPGRHLSGGAGTSEGMGHATRTKRTLSPARQRLVELMQEVNFGRIEGLRIRDGDPVLEPPPRVLRDFLFGKTNAPNVARNRDDFVLKEQVIELFDLFDRERSVTVESLVVQNGLPVRMTVADAARVA
jgi:hypothetical protein